MAPSGLKTFLTQKRLMNGPIQVSAVTLSYLSTHPQGACTARGPIYRTHTENIKDTHRKRAR